MFALPLKTFHNLVPSLSNNSCMILKTWGQLDFFRVLRLFSLWLKHVWFSFLERIFSNRLPLDFYPTLCFPPSVLSLSFMAQCKHNIPENDLITTFSSHYSPCMDVRIGLWRELSTEELMLLNCGVAEDSWESLGLQGDPTIPSKGNQSWIFTGRTDAEAETPILWPPDAKNWLIWKDPMLGKIEGGKRRGNRGWDGWMASPT